MAGSSSRDLNFSFCNELITCWIAEIKVELFKDVPVSYLMASNPFLEVISMFKKSLAF